VRHNRNNDTAPQSCASGYARKTDTEGYACRADVATNEITAIPYKFMGTVKRQASILAHVAVVTDVTEIGAYEGDPTEDPLEQAAAHQA
jgi:hypothetical protein